MYQYACFNRAGFTPNSTDYNWPSLICKLFTSLSLSISVIILLNNVNIGSSIDLHVAKLSNIMKDVSHQRRTAYLYHQNKHSFDILKHTRHTSNHMIFVYYLMMLQYT